MQRKPGSSRPALLVQAFIFAEEHLLLMKRGQHPYIGSWGTPGGFVEAHESPEAAVIRETREEVGLELDMERLLPLATVSVESINQVHLMFIVQLDAMVPLKPALPEALDARWWPKDSFPLQEIWEPFARFDMSILFERVKAGRFEYYQRTDDFIRVISGRQDIRYLRRNNP